MRDSSSSPRSAMPPSQRPTGWMTRRYVMALAAVAMLAVAGFGAFQALVAAHDRTLAVVNMSGRQRMLSQRIALYVEKLANDSCASPAACTARLIRALEQFSTAHRALAFGSEMLDMPGPTSEAVSRLYFDGSPSLHDRLERYIAAGYEVAATDPERLSPDSAPARHVLTEGPGPLLEALDKVVLQYQHDGEQALAMLRLLEILLVLLTLATLLLEALFIFQPMVARIRRQFDQIDTMSTSLRRANEDLEARVHARTRELSAAKAEAEKATRSKSHFLAAAGHDMLQPLQAAEMFTGLLEKEPLTPRGQRVLGDLLRTQASLRHLVRSVLDVSKLEAGAVVAAPQPVAVAPLLHAMAADYGAQALDKNLRLNVVAPDLWVVSDPLLLERILRNLVSNAIRYTDTGGVVVGARRRGNRVWLQVVDSGIGIAAADQQRIFQDFVQVGEVTRDRSEGLGLGLGIVERLCRLLGHRVWVKSTRGRGSVFTVDCRSASSPPQDFADP